jgi:hypothetical protein
MIQPNIACGGVIQPTPCIPGSHVGSFRRIVRDDFDVFNAGERVFGELEQVRAIRARCIDGAIGFSD